MKKSEIKSGVKNIITTTNNIRGQIDNILKPIYEIKKHFDAVEKLESKYDIACDTNFDEVIGGAINNYMDCNDPLSEIDYAFEDLISDLEDWMEELSEDKQEQIQEEYIDVLEKLREGLDTSDIYDKESLDKLLVDLINAINNSGLME